MGNPMPLTFLEPIVIVQHGNSDLEARQVLSAFHELADNAGTPDRFDLWNDADAADKAVCRLIARRVAEA